MIKMNRKYVEKTFDECFQQFLMEHCTLKNMRDDTKRYYIQNMEYGFYKYYDKDTNINQLSQDDINGYIIHLQKRDIKDTTINIYLKALKTVLIFFKKKFWIDSNITVQFVREDKQQVEGYTDEEILKLLEKPNLKKCTFAQYRNWVLVNFLCNTGARRSTIINIHKEDLDLENGYCKFRHTKNRKPLTVPITLSMISILKEYIEYLPLDCPYLFPSISGEQMKERGLTRAIEDYNKSKGVERTSIHAFRHWYAKKSVLNGVNIVQLQHLLGHSNLEILKHYVEMLTEDLNYKDIAQNPLESIKLKSKKDRNIKLR
ncbi:site-specific integrase [Clostridium sp.]|uniref:tyrosine-type recombinase/integrase n=1 Tax=Clostridium sp. TaxID=1506 RepID=UPI0029021B5E|nr:site-specific integrase [Clostridium sp.]MDU7259505.1 site-specific integrase [Clostridium butyricum]MDU1069894.1 site-specific integrase [Clostridium sp.]MDU2677800.1 site-specific integrase [Clostridium sp.]MDU4213826.1 site-specific integrase [Clostridium sp.]MDU5173786.1 site-specific integrase [Clostridium sp.]